jgi:predicted metalloenzyme YecM
MTISLSQTYKPLTSLLLQDAPPFVSKILSHLKQTYPLTLAPLLRSYTCDHICLRVSTAEEYEYRKKEFENLGSVLLVESLVGGRMIASYKLPRTHGVQVEDPDWIPSSGSHADAAPIVDGSKRDKGDFWVEDTFGMAGKRFIDVVELPSPKPGSFYESGWEHVEFSMGLKEFFRGSDLPQAGISGDGDDVGRWIVGELVKMGEEKRVSEARRCIEEFEKLLSAKEKAIQGRDGHLDGDVKVIKWDKKGMKKGGFNMDLRLDYEGGVTPEDGGFSVKFHWMPLEVVIGVENAEHSI